MALTRTALILFASISAASATQHDFFEAKIRPILATQCYDCHSAAKSKGGLALDSREALRKGGDRGPAIIPGDSMGSLLISAISHTHEKLHMPRDAPKLDAGVIADFIRWIDEGAPDPRDTPDKSATAKSWPEMLAERREWWCFQPVKRQSAKFSVSTEDSYSNPIDAFLLARMQRDGLTFAPPPEPATLIRRASFILTGLPPTPEELDSGIANPESGIQKLLSSPRFGEHWARHWMDIIRYGETYGSEHDALMPHAWRYRDYLVRAFNDDVPYDRFVMEHLAGDLIAPRWNAKTKSNDALIATASLRMVEFFPVPTDPKAEQVNTMESVIDGFGRVFQGLTIACARCHDHKFDAISARDFHALYGIFASSRTTMHRVTDPALAHQHDAALFELKKQIRARLAAIWLDEIQTQPAKWPPQPNQNHQATTPRADVTVLADFSTGKDCGWHASRDHFTAASRPGNFAIATSGERAITAIYPAGRYSHLISDKHGGSWRSPSFTITAPHISALVCGTNDARVRLIVEGFDGTELLFEPATPKLKNPRLHWQRLTMRTQWLGQRAYIEIIPRDDLTYPSKLSDAKKLDTDGRSGIGIVRVVTHQAPASPAMPAAFPESKWPQMQRLLQAAITAWRDDNATNEQALLLDAMVDAGLLSNDARQLPAITSYRDLEKQIPVPQRIPGVTDEGGANEKLMPRGDHKLATEIVPRRYLEVLDSKPIATQGSGRLDLARQIASPSNPLTARVMVNRLWHHVFGAGIVRSVDNFGRLGELPSHPELLDWLASEFVARRWSVKDMLRLMLTSRAFQQSDAASSLASQRDPSNRLLSHWSVRRLPAESIRDAMLSVSGRLVTDTGGPGTPLPLPKEFNVFDPHVDGPVDGDNRRSIYLEARRGHPQLFLAAFDAPRSTLIVGARDVTNVPAQSLAMQNDPFVWQMAESFAARCSSESDARSRITTMYRLALARPPMEHETNRALDFISDDPETWRDLAQALFNTKEFMFLK